MEDLFQQRNKLLKKVIKKESEPCLQFYKQLEFMEECSRTKAFPTILQIMFFHIGRGYFARLCRINV